MRKARGAFFTPPALCRHVAGWSIRAPTDRILEPSCGEAAFLLAAARRLETLGGLRAGRLVGIELHEASARDAARLLEAGRVKASIVAGDFFERVPSPDFDAVIGNPPFVRYQDFAGEARAQARRAALRAGVALTGLASSWAAFTVHGALFLRRGGRLGLVLPAELLTVNYAAQVRRFLMDRFRRVELVLFTERVFPGVQEEVVLLLAEGFDEGPTDHCELHQVRNAEELLVPSPAPRRWKPETRGGKWTGSLLDVDALAAYEGVRTGGGFSVLEAWGDTTLGMVTGHNAFFTLTPSQVGTLGLRRGDVLRLSPPGSRHLRSLTFTRESWKKMGTLGRPTLLFRPQGRPSAAAARYIRHGEATGVPGGYKCRHRSPWWLVPLVPPADLFLTYMNADTPRLCSNPSGAHHLNSVHGVYLKPGLRAAAEQLPLGALNSVTLLGAETVGRSYGGGMLKLEPKEADRLPVPSPDVMGRTRANFASIRSRAARAVEGGALLEAVGLVDDVLLIGELGLPANDVRALRNAHVELRARRTARGAAPRRLAP